MNIERGGMGFGEENFSSNTVESVSDKMAYLYENTRVWEDDVITSGLENLPKALEEVKGSMYADSLVSGMMASDGGAWFPSLVRVEGDFNARNLKSLAGFEGLVYVGGDAHLEMCESVDNVNEGFFKSFATRGGDNTLYLQRLSDEAIKSLRDKYEGIRIVKLGF